MSVTDILFTYKDEKYKDFHSKLIPNVPKDSIIGVRVPVIRNLAKEMSKSGEWEVFIKELPHKFYDENILHAAILLGIKDYDECLAYVEEFLPYIDNWAACDILSPKVFARNKQHLLNRISAWIKSEHTYTVRFAIKMLMDFYLGSDFSTEYADMVAAVQSGEYYVRMMAAWYFATALAKNYEETIPYIEECRLEKWTHNKTVQKATESYRITEEQKTYLRTLKIK